MLSSVEYCPVCQRQTEMLVVPMRLPIFDTGAFKGQVGRRIGTVTSWVVCASCNTAVRSTEKYTVAFDVPLTIEADLEIIK
jgi:hypothetical protein